MLGDVKKPLKNKDELAFLVDQLQEKLQKKSVEKSDLEKRVKDQSQLITQLYEQLKLSRHRQFGKSSEKQPTDHPQALLFNEAEYPSDQKVLEAEEETITIPAHQRPKSKKPGRKSLP
ncbi:MAG TPA: transposase, partial [Gammaproteobacteria bacterium]|nr:transposase [Gammaproteobacteria bacterium]